MTKGNLIFNGSVLEAAVADSNSLYFNFTSTYLDNRCIFSDCSQKLNSIFIVADWYYRKRLDSTVFAILTPGNLILTLIKT
jgi:hypothetical protein